MCAMSTTASPDPRLAALPSTAIALVLGYQAARPVDVHESGRVAALVDELRRRDEYGTTMAALGSDLASAIHTLYIADRGQRWSRSAQSR